MSHSPQLRKTSLMQRCFTQCWCTLDQSSAHPAPMQGILALLCSALVTHASKTAQHCKLQSDIPHSVDHAQFVSGQHRHDEVTLRDEEKHMASEKCFAKVWGYPSPSKAIQKAASELGGNCTAELPCVELQTQQQQSGHASQHTKKRVEGILFGKLRQKCGEPTRH